MAPGMQVDPLPSLTPGLRVWLVEGHQPPSVITGLVPVIPIA